ncbi:MAG: hypothetical protein C4297_09835 [Gemmataceae bacterium]
MGKLDSIGTRDGHGNIGASEVRKRYLFGALFFSLAVAGWIGLSVSGVGELWRVALFPLWLMAFLAWWEVKERT